MCNFDTESTIARTKQSGNARILYAKSKLLDSEVTKLELPTSKHSYS